MKYVIFAYGSYAEKNQGLLPSLDDIVAYSYSSLENIPKSFNNKPVINLKDLVSSNVVFDKVLICSSVNSWSSCIKDCINAGLPIGKIKILDSDADVYSIHLMNQLYLNLKEEFTNKVSVLYDNIYNNIYTQLKNDLYSSLSNDTYVSEFVAQLHKNTFSKFKGINKNKCVVIVGRGPTIKKFVPNIKNAVYVGTNNVIKMEKIPIDYLFVQDFHHMPKDDINQIINFKGELFLGKFFFPILKENPSVPNWLHEICIPEGFFLRPNVHKYVAGLFNKFFYPDIDCFPVVDMGSVIFPAVHFAFFTHPQKIYLVGCDCSQGHFDDNTGDSSPLVKGWKMIKLFRDIYYPDVEIISINPVGLKGLFKDEYT